MSWGDVYKDFDVLPDDEKLILYETIKETLFPEPKLRLDQVAKEVRDARFSSGFACLHCGSVKVKRNGKIPFPSKISMQGLRKVIQRHDCQPLSGTRYPDKWLKFIKYMLDGLTLPKIANRLGIQVSTVLQDMSRRANNLTVEHLRTV